MVEDKYKYSHDLEIVTSMLERLENYLLSDEVYGNQGMFIEGLPAITIGGLLMRLRRLNALREFIGKSNQKKLDTAIARHDALYNEWTVHYEKKLHAELDSRLTRIRQFIDEVKENPRSMTVSFEPEQMRRTIIQEILYMIQRSSIEANGLKDDIVTLDTDLKPLVKKANFSWASELQTVYSPEEFWWLYSQLDRKAISKLNK